MKVKMVTRKLKFTLCDVLVVDVNRCTSKVFTFEFYGVYLTDKQILSQANNELENKDLKAVLVQRSQVITKKYELPESTFYKQGTLLKEKEKTKHEQN